ncbi:MAG: hypothetical protein KF799_09930 [Bdellovibrionales bacterium]|nr:hypothetical protein [Bdellovibrionales bacterium]
MKLLTLVILMMSATAWAAPLSSQEKARWVTEIDQACAAVFEGPNIPAVCKCVARNFVILAQDSQDSLAKTRDTLKFIKGFYSDEISQAQIDADPFFIGPFFESIGLKCIASPRYQLKLK